MKPIAKNEKLQKEFFRVELEGLIDKTHLLAKLSGLIDWQKISDEFGVYYHEHMGRPGKPVRLMAGLLLLQHTFKCSDEEIVARFVENPYYQYFCGNDFFEHRLPIDPTALIKWRKRIGKEGCEKILKLTLDAGLKSQTIKARDFKRTIVDTTGFRTLPESIGKDGIKGKRIRAKTQTDLRGNSPASCLPNLQICPCKTIQKNEPCPQNS